MTSILETLQSQLGPSTIQQISQSVGADPQATASAITAALPALLGGLSQNASNPQGALALDQALDAHDGSILDNLGGLLRGGVATSIGGAILGHILGAKRGPVEQGVGKASGLSPAQVGQILMMLAPIVMGVLGRAKKQSNLDATRLPDVLQQSAQQVQQQAPGVGSVLDEVMNAGKSVMESVFAKK